MSDLVYQIRHYFLSKNINNSSIQPLHKNQASLLWSAEPDKTKCQKHFIQCYWDSASQKSQPGHNTEARHYCHLHS